MNIGDKISELRKKSILSQEQLAEKLGVTRQTMSKWELGETSPDIKQAKELSKIFKVSLDELVDNDVSDIIIEKISNTERLAQLIIKIIKGIGILILSAILLGIIYLLVHTEAWFIGEGRQYSCSIGKETYNIEIWSYDDNSHNKDYGHKNHWSCPDCDLDRLTEIKKYINYDDLSETEMFIAAYFKSLGGSCN